MSKKTNKTYIKDLLESFLKEKHNKVYASKKYSLNPSVLGDSCLRKKYFSYFKIPQKPKEIPGILIMESGIGMHEQIQGWLAETKVAIDYLDPKTGQPPINFGKRDIEFPISIPELLIQKGKIDRVIRIDGKLWVVEIKSVGTEKFRALKEPIMEHVIQGTVYVFAFEKGLRQEEYSHIPGLSTEEPVEGVLMLYVNRDTGAMKEFCIPRNEQLFVQICEDINEIAQYILKKELPPPPPGGMCQYCPYPDWCRNNRNVE